MSDEDNDLVSSVVIKAGNNGGWVGEAVLFEKTIESLLDDLLVSQVGNRDLGSEDGVEVSSSIKSGLVVFSCGPEVVFADDPLVDLEEVESGIGDEFFNDGLRISLIGDAVFEADGLDILVVLEALLDGFGERVEELLDFGDKVDEVGD